MLFITCTLGVATVILLLPILWNIKRLAGTLRHLIETNQEYIKRTIRTMPEVFENMGQVSRNVRETSDKLKISVPSVLQEIECITNAAKISIDLKGAVIESVSSGINEASISYKKDHPSFMDYFHSIEEVLQIIYRMFSSNK